MARSSLIAVVIFSSVILLAVILDKCDMSKSTPVVQIVGLLGGLTGPFVGLWVSAWERRHFTLTALMDELRRDASILADPPYAPSRQTPRLRVYPRLPVLATDAALTLGALAERSDDELLRRLRNWRDEVNKFNEFNWRLELTEFIGFIARDPTGIAEFERVLHYGEGYLNQIRRDLRELRDYLAANYQVAAERDEKSGGSGGSHGWRLFRRLRRLASSMPSLTAVRSAW